jgi:glycosyltransferase involved in cell wall biosynthesis
MDYAVARILQRDGRLERLYTDFYAGDAGTTLLAALPAGWRGDLVNRAVGRASAEVPRDLVRSFPMLGMEYYLRRRLAGDAGSRTQLYLDVGKKFGSRVVDGGFGGAHSIYVYNTAAFEILQAAKRLGMRRVLEQTIAPRAVEEALLAAEHEQFEAWEHFQNSRQVASDTVDREREEWRLADTIICGSVFVQQAIADCGGPVERCVVVPYGVDHGFEFIDRDIHNGPLRVLTVGQVGLRKGIGYAASVAKQLGSRAHFRWVGPCNLLAEGRRQVGSHIELTGPVLRAEVLEHLRWADVFFLPTVCEGSATVTYEALATGLPVVTTPNAGSLVENGVNGFVVPIRQWRVMAERLLELHDDRIKLAAMGRATRSARTIGSLDAYRERLLKAVA